MRVGLFTDGLAELSRGEALTWCAERGILDLEMGVGSWSPRPHLDLDALLREPSERDRLLGELRGAGCRLAAVNAAGNPLHPEPGAREDAQARLRGAVELAALVGCSTVVTMSGCPGTRSGGTIGAFGVWSVSADDEGLWTWQIDQVVTPWWTEFSRWAAEAAPGVSICLELHPGLTVFGVEGFQRLRRGAGANIQVNLDPSHFWWQGVDPALVAEALAGSIGHAHGKDTTIYPERVALHGVLDPRGHEGAADGAWHFSACGQGRGITEWTHLLEALRRAGYDGVMAIEHEDPLLAPLASIEASARALTDAGCEIGAP